jgi:hypothetical protein
MKFFGYEDAESVSRRPSVSFDNTARLAIGTDGVGGFQGYSVRSTDVIEETRSADKSRMMKMAIEWLTGDYRARPIIRVWLDYDDRARVMAKEGIGVKVTVIVRRIRLDRRRGPPVTMDIVAGGAASVSRRDPAGQRQE